MAKIEVQLLDTLLDKYEHSVGFVEARSQQRRILLFMYGAHRKDFPLYDIEDSQICKRINKAALALEEQGLVQVEWMRGEEGHILSRIALNPQNIAQAYQSAGRQPLADAVAALEGQLSALLEKCGADWAKRYLQEQLAFLARNRRPPAAFPASGADREAWLAVLAEASAPRMEPMLERVFSLRCLGSSKAFEQHYRSRLVGILRKYLPLDTAEMDEEELLRQIGLEKYPEIFSIAGAVAFRWPDGRSVDAAPLADGLQISARDAEQARPILCSGVDTLLFVENKANYYAQIRSHACPQTVVVFHGGFYSPQRGRFFQKLCRAAGPGVRLLHWGDIDLGGFEMDSRLRREIDPRFTAWRMGCAELDSHREQAVPFSAEYAQKLERLLEDPFLQDSWDVIRSMLREHLRLEQEALI